jgi:hypothetical protein
MPTFSEPDLIIPALEIIAARPNGISTSELKPSGDDLEILANRSDDKFSQKVRNLNSHGTLEKRRLAIFKGGRLISQGRAKFAEPSVVMKFM